MLKPTPKSRVLFVRKCSLALLVLFGVFVFTAFSLRSPHKAFATTTNTVNFQARLQTAAGGIVPDGNYNVEFKLYSVSSGGTALWTEDYLNSASNGLQTVNGYLSANLGSITGFPGTIDWSQKLWLTMNIGGTSTGSVTWDGEMNPRIILTAVPYAFQAGRASTADQLSTTSGSNASTLSIQAPTGGDQTFVIQDQGTSGTFNILTAPNGSDGYIKLQGSSPSQQTGYFNISGTGIATTLQAGTFDAASSGALNIGTTNATSINLEQDTSVASGKTLTINGSGFDANGNLGIGTTSPARQIDIQTTTTSTNSLPLLLQQNGTGDVGIELAVPSQSYYVGIDGTNNSFEISSSAASNAQTNFGYTGVGTSTDSGDRNHILATKFTATATGTVSSLYAHIASPISSSPNNKGQMAIYSDNNGSPDTLLASSGDVTLTGDAWNLFAISSVSVTSGQVYWLAFNSNAASDSDSNVQFHSGTSNQTKILVQTYGTWPGSWSGGNNSSAEISYYGVINATAGSDNFSTSLFSLNQTGQATFQNSTDSSTAFQVQNASGVNILNVDTSAGKLSLGTASSLTGSVTFNNSGSAYGITLTGAAETVGSATITIPDTAGVDDTVCLQTKANCGSTLTVGSLDSGTANANGATLTSSNLYLQSASASFAGLVNTTSQTFAGDKTFTGTTTFSHSGSSLTAFQITDGSSAIFDIDTTNGRVAINNTNPAYALDVNGDINSNTNVRVGGIAVCVQTGCTPSTGSSNYIQNSTSTQDSANLNIRSAATGAVTAVIQGANGQTADVFQVASWNGTSTANLASISSAGVLTIGSSSQFTVDASGNFTAKGNGTIKSTSTAAFSVQNASNVAYFTVDTSTGAITIGNSASGNYVSFAASGGFIAYGTAQHAKSIVLYPEYAGAVFDAQDDSSCSSANSGTLTTGWDSTNRANYYNWTSSSGTSQCYDVVVQVNLPSDWSSWDSSDPINIQTKTDNTSNSSVSFKIMNSAGTADTNYNYGSPSISTSWTDSASSSLAGTYTANSTMYLKIRLSAKSSANVKLGAITLNYNSKY